MSSVACTGALQHVDSNFRITWLRTICLTTKPQLPQQVEVNFFPNSNQGNSKWEVKYYQFEKGSPAAFFLNS